MVKMQHRGIVCRHSAATKLGFKAVPWVVNGAGGISACGMLDSCMWWSNACQGSADYRSLQHDRQADVTPRTHHLLQG